MQVQVVPVTTRGWTQPRRRVNSWPRSGIASEASGVVILPRFKEVRLGRVIRERRRQLGLSQRELARRIKASKPYIQLLESTSGSLPRTLSTDSPTFRAWTDAKCSS